MIRLTIRSDAFGMTRIGLARVDYVLSNLYYFSIFETDGIYGVADPRKGGRIPIRVTRCRMGLPVVDMLKHTFERLTLGVYTIGVGDQSVCPSLTILRVRLLLSG
jgi:hypothetical protein